MRRLVTAGRKPILITDDSNCVHLTCEEQLFDYFAAGSKPKASWAIGTEHEKFPFRLSTMQPVSYDETKGIRDLLHVLKVYGWQDITERGNVIGLRRGGAIISLEPGGQVELSGRPVANLHETAAEIDQHLEELREIERLLDIGFLGIGYHPTAKGDAISWMPKQRYAMMRDYLPTRGRCGLDMMKRTCTTQVNLDYADEADMVIKMQLALALQPVATALFAASPFAEGMVNGYQSWRMAMWQDTDPDRCGALPLVFADDFGFARYAAYALDVPMFFVKRGETLINAAGQSFRDFMAGSLPALPGAYPTADDWALHLSTLFPDVRLKQYLELRGADCGNAELILALPSFWTGLLYDETARAAAWDIVADWTEAERQYLHQEVPKQGLHLPFRDGKVQDIAHKAVILAQQGLRRRAVRLHGGADETRYLDGLFMITESGVSYASDLIARLEHQWHGKIEHIFTDCRL